MRWTRSAPVRAWGAPSRRVLERLGFVTMCTLTPENGPGDMLVTSKVL